MTLLQLRLRAALAELMEMPAEDLSITAELGEQGVDSLVGLRFARKIAELTGTEIDLEWLYDHPTIAEIAQLLEQQTAAVNHG